MADIPSPGVRRDRRASATKILTILAIALISLALVAMPQLRFMALHAGFYDLGQYATILYAAGPGGEGGQLLGGHAHLFGGLYALVYQAWASPALLLAIQSIVLIASALVAGLVWRRAGAGEPLTGALIFLLSASVWWNAIFDFHFEHLVFPIMLGAMLLSWSDRSSRLWAAAGLALTLCLVKEAYTLTAAAFGLYLIVGRRSLLPGLVAFVLGLGAFFLLTGEVIADWTGGTNAGGLWTGAFGHLGDSVGEMIVTIVTEPLRVLQTIIDPRKILSLFVLGVPFLFLFLLSPLALIPAVPALALSLLSQNPSHYYIATQYSAGVMPVLFCASALTLGQRRLPFREFLTPGILLSSLAVLVAFGPTPISRLFLQDRSFSFGASAYLPSARDNRIRQLIADTIPADPTIVVATQNTLVTREIAARRMLLAFPHGVFEPVTPPIAVEENVVTAAAGALASPPVATEPLLADYVVLDLEREWYVADEGCGWRDGRCERADVAQRFEETLERLRGTFRLLVEEDGLLIYERVRDASSAETRAESS